ncbi:hypothetical protein D3C76_1536980 [compost metagenome]
MTPVFHFEGDRVRIRGDFLEQNQQSAECLRIHRAFDLHRVAFLGFHAEVDFDAGVVLDQLDAKAWRVGTVLDRGTVQAQFAVIQAHRIAAGFLISVGH